MSRTATLFVTVHVAGSTKPTYMNLDKGTYEELKDLWEEPTNFGLTSNSVVDVRDERPGMIHKVRLGSILSMRSEPLRTRAERKEE